MLRIRYILTFVVWLAALSASAQGTAAATDTLEIRFGLDEVAVDMGFGGNSERWEAFERGFMRRFGTMDPLGVKIDIYAGASPEGNQEHNRWLGQERGESIRRLIEQRLRGKVGYIVIHNEAARWQGLYDALAAGNEAWRDEALRIIRRPASTNEYGRDPREWYLRHRLPEGAWDALMSGYLPPLRSGASAIVSWCPENLSAGRDTIVVRETLVVKDTVYVMQPVVTRLGPDDTEVLETIAELKPVQRYPVWILRGNLLLLATGTPNLQAEWSLGHKDRWSVNIEGIWSWWTFARNAYANEILYGSVELRHWLGRRYRHHTLSGWHIGIGIGGGYGDVEWKSRGYQAEVYSGFMNIGWQGRFGKRRQWAFDMGIGLGYAYVPWRRYRGSRIYPEGKEERYDDHLMYMETNRTHWIGTPHVNISIGYVFPQKDARWRRERAVEREAARYAELQQRDSVLAYGRYLRDSVQTARKQQLKEIELLPKDERKAAMERYYADKKLARTEAKAARKQLKAESKELARQEKAAKKQGKLQQEEEKALRKRQLKDEKERLQAERQRQRELARSPEGRTELRQQQAEAKAAEKQAKADAKAAKRQARIEKKQQKIRSRMEARQQRHQSRLRQELEQSRMKYKIDN